jgi:hypothetical protein
MEGAGEKAIRDAGADPRRSDQNNAEASHQAVEPAGLEPAASSVQATRSPS